MSKVKTSKKLFQDISTLVVSFFACTSNVFADTCSYDTRAIGIRNSFQNPQLFPVHPVKTERFSFLDVVDKDPAFATAGARIQIEKRLQALSMAASPNTPVPSGIHNQLGLLQSKKILLTPQVNAIGRFTAIANEAAHGADVDGIAIKALLKEDVPRVLQFLEELLVRVRA